MTQEDPARSAQLLEAFNVYRTQPLLDLLDKPRTFAFVGGVVVESRARVISADPGGVVVKVDRVQLSALDLTRSALVESPLHGTSFRAVVDAIDHRRGYVSLCGFEPFAAYQERRGVSRAAPGVPLLVKVFGRGHEARGRVVDLSTAALSADFEAASFARVSRAPLVRLEVWGENSEHVALQDFVTTARIRRTDTRTDSSVPACRAVLELDSYPALTRALRRYVARRQRDILTKLRLSGNTAADGCL